MQEINKEIITILKEFKIDVDEGLLCLLGIYHKLDVEKVCSEETIKAINLTKIVDKEYGNTTTIKWKIPLFTGQQTEWDWVATEYNALWDKAKIRKDSNPDVTRRMIEWFKAYPIYRKEDVIKATKAYMVTQTDPQYTKRSALFIFDGKGAMKTSMLASWCEKTKGNTGNTNTMKGVVVK